MASPVPAAQKTAALKIAAVAVVAALGGVGLGFFAFGTSAPTSQTVVIAILPTASAADIQPRAAELEAFLEAEVGADVQIIIPTTYASVIEAIRFGHAQAGFMSAWPAYLANKYAGAELKLAEVRSVINNQTPVEATYYFSHFIVLQNSSWQDLEDLRGARVAFPSTLSTSGYLYPLARLVELGLVSQPASGKQADPAEFFGEVTFAGGYAQAWQALKAGQVDVIVMAGDVSASLYNEAMNATRVLATQGPVPSHGVVFAKEFTGPLADKLEAALMKLGEPAHRDLMRKLVSGIFVRFEARTTDEHLDALQAALAQTGLQWTERL